MRGVRVVLEPTFDGSEREPIRSDHARVGLGKLGPNASKLKVASSKSAELVFKLAYLVQARKVSEPDFSELARVTGQLERDEKGRVTFKLDPDWDYQPLSRQEEDDPARFLLLSYGGGGFEDPGADRARKLVLPKAPEKTRFLELGVDLKVDGAPEATLEVNDVLDIPMRLVPQDLTGRLRVAIGLPYEDFKLANRTYKLTVDGVVYFGTISSGGEIFLPKKIEKGKGKLEIQPFEGSSRSYSWELDIGSLADHAAVDGVQSRLNNQAFTAGAGDGNAGPRTEQALRSFQHRHGLLADGTLSEETKLKLRAVHGC